jgi:tetratricopeptide (TPR) repeat protein
MVGGISRRGKSRLHIGRALIFLFAPTLCVSPLNSHQDKSPRVIRLKLAADLDLRPNPEWKMNVRRLVSECSLVFEGRFGIQFDVEETGYWRPSNSARSIWDSLNDLMENVSPGKSDLVLGVLLDKSRGSIPYGLSSYSRGYVLIKYLNSKETMKAVLLHELCHLFGAIDLEEPGSIMHLANPGYQFDQFTEGIILLNRDRSFHSDSIPWPEEHLAEAISLFETRAALNRGEPEVHRILALLYFKKQEYSLAAAECQRTLEINPERAEIHNIMGNICLRQGEVDEAIEEYTLALRRLPNSPELHFNLGLAYYRKGEVDKAIDRLQRVIELNPRYEKARTGLSYLYLDQGKIDPAIRECQKALQFIPGDAEMLSTSAVALVLKYDSMKKEMSPGEQNSPEDGPSLPSESTADGLLEKAKTYCLEAIRINAGLPEAHNILGVIYAYQDKYGDAETEFLRALGLKPDFVHAQHNLSFLYFKNEEWEKSAYHMKKIIDIYISSGQGSQILAKLFGHQRNYYMAIKPFE